MASGEIHRSATRGQFAVFANAIRLGRKTRKLRSKELVVIQIANEVGGRFYAQLIESSTLVCADCLGAEVQFGCDLGARPACRNRQQDLALLVRQIVLDCRRSAVVPFPRSGFTEMLLAIEHIADGHQHLGITNAVCDVTRGAELHGTSTVQRIRVHTQHEYRGLWTTGEDLPKDRKAIIVRKTATEDNQAPRMYLDSSYGFFGSPCLAKDYVPVFSANYQPQALTNECMNIDNQYRQLLCLWHNSSTVARLLCRYSAQSESEFGQQTDETSSAIRKRSFSRPLTTKRGKRFTCNRLYEASLFRYSPTPPTRKPAAKSVMPSHDFAGTDKKQPLGAIEFRRATE